MTEDRIRSLINKSKSLSEIDLEIQIDVEREKCKKDPNYRSSLLQSTDKVVGKLPPNPISAPVVTTPPGQQLSAQPTDNVVGKLPPNPATAPVVTAPPGQQLAPQTQPADNVVGKLPPNPAPAPMVTAPPGQQPVSQPPGNAVEKTANLVTMPNVAPPPVAVSPTNNQALVKVDVWGKIKNKYYSLYVSDTAASKNIEEIMDAWWVLSAYIPKEKAKVTDKLEYLKGLVKEAEKKEVKR